VVSGFTALAEPDFWEISPGAGVAVIMFIEFDINGVNTQIPGNDNPVHFLISLFFRGDTFFDAPQKDPWLPGDSGVSNPVRYDIVEVGISGGTVQGVLPKVGCVTDGKAPRTSLGDNKSTLVITAQ